MPKYQPFDALSRNARFLCNFLGRVTREPAGPVLYYCPGLPGVPGLPQSGLHDDVSQPQRHDAIHTGLHGHPLVGVRARERHPRFDLYQLAARLRMALAHRAVVHRLRDRRVPGAEEIGAE